MKSTPGRTEKETKVMNFFASLLQQNENHHGEQKAGREAEKDARIEEIDAMEEKIKQEEVVIIPETETVS